VHLKIALRISHLDGHLECLWYIDDDLALCGLCLLLGGNEVVTSHVSNPASNVQEPDGGDLHQCTACQQQLLADAVIRRGGHLMFI